MLKKLAALATRRAHRTNSIGWLKLAWWLRDARSWLRGGPSWSELSAERDRHFRRSRPHARVELNMGQGT